MILSLARRMLIGRERDLWKIRPLQIISSALCHGDSIINDCAMFSLNYFSYVHLTRKLIVIVSYVWVRKISWYNSYNVCCHYFLNAPCIWTYSFTATTNLISSVHDNIVAFHTITQTCATRALKCIWKLKLFRNTRYLNL